MTGRDGYLKAREYLRRDFGYRCAYCMIHERQTGGSEGFWIDHFRPRSKGGHVNDYNNLYWSCIGCNHIKGQAWPSTAEQRRGWRFADPCAEQDYGVHFVEDEAGELIPQTPCGQYHVWTLGLNRPSRVARRRERKEFGALLAEAMALVGHLQQQPAPLLERKAIDHIHREIEVLQAELAVAIPYITYHRKAARSLPELPSHQRPPNVVRSMAGK